MYSEIHAGNMQIAQIIRSYIFMIYHMQTEINSTIVNRYHSQIHYLSLC